MNQAELTLICAVCGATRPDRFISVYQELTNGRPGAPVPYCNDNVVCIGLKGSRAPIQPAAAVGGQRPRVTVGSSNLFDVVMRGDGLICIYGACHKHMTREQAVNLAVWLLTLADPTGEISMGLRAEIKKS